MFLRLATKSTRPHSRMYATKLTKENLADLQPYLKPLQSPLTEARLRNIETSHQERPEKFPLWVKELAKDFSKANMMHTMHLEKLASTLPRRHYMENWYASCRNNIDWHIKGETQKALLSFYAMDLYTSVSVMSGFTETALKKYLEENLMDLEEAREFEFYDLFIQTYQNTTDPQERQAAINSIEVKDLYYILDVGWKKLKMEATANNVMDEKDFDMMTRLWLHAGEMVGESHSLERILTSRKEIFLNYFNAVSTEENQKKYQLFAALLFKYIDETREISTMCFRSSMNISNELSKE